MNAKNTTLLLGLALAAAAFASSCVRAGYVVQAGMGQLRLWGAARPISEVIADPATSPRTRVLLGEVVHIRRYAEAHGLDTRSNYTHYVELEHGAVVWFLAASRPLAFEPKVWGFPIVGSFTYLGWFSQDEARRIGRLLESEGWEIFVRPVRAFSTGGWFHDPVLSSMLSADDDAFRYLANVLFHELTHANILINDQSTFNESVASFVGDTMADDYLVSRFGAGSDEVAAFRRELAEDRQRGERMVAAYRELGALYLSSASDGDKRARKQRVVDGLAAELRLSYRPTNAMLVGFKTYNAGMDEFAALYAACGRQWPRFLAAVGTLSPSSFAREQEEDIAPVIGALAAAGCPERP